MEWNGIVRKKVEDSNCIRQLVLTPYPSLYIWLASYPGLLAPAFVACSTNAGEGLVKLSHVV